MKPRSWLSFLATTDAEASQICLASMYNRSSLDYRFAFLTTNPSKEQLVQALIQGSFIKKQESAYLIFDDLDFTMPKTHLNNSSIRAKAKIQAIENPSFKLGAKQKTDMITQIVLLDLLTQAKIKYRTIICSESNLYSILFYLDCISLEAIANHLNSGLRSSYSL